MMWLLPIPGYILSGLIIWLYLTLSAELILFFKKKWITDILITVLWILYGVVMIFSMEVVLNINSMFENTIINNDNTIYKLYKIALWGVGAVLSMLHIKKKYLKRMQDRGYYIKK